MHFKIPKLDKLVGIIDDVIPAGETGRIMVKGFLTSDDPKFHIAADHISAILLNKHVQTDSVNTFLALLHQDQSADVYVNDIAIGIQVHAKRSLVKGEAVRVNDIVDIKALRFLEIKVEQTDNIIFLFKKGWKFGFFLNLQQWEGKNKLDVASLERELGDYYKYLAFEKELKVIEDKQSFEELFDDGWFPFIQLLGGEYPELGHIYQTGEKSGEPMEQFLNKFGQERIARMKQNWWDCPVFAAKKVIIEAALSSYLLMTGTGFINCIKNLYSEIEGVIRVSCHRKTGQKPTFSKLVTFLEHKAANKFTSINSLAFPPIFAKYLREVIFKDFDLSTGQVDISRHSVVHGVAEAVAYSRAKALQSILTLDQIYFYLI